MSIYFVINVLLLSSCVTRTTCLYSSFWFPSPKSQYTVDVAFSQQQGMLTRDEYRTRYGYRGESLIAALGNGGNIPSYREVHYNNVYGDVKVHYKYSSDDK